jgi:hypothetical protein
MTGCWLGAGYWVLANIQCAMCCYKVYDCMEIPTHPTPACDLRLASPSHVACRTQSSAQLVAQQFQQPAAASGQRPASSEVGEVAALGRRPI